MTQQISPFIEAKYGWDLGESGWNTGMDENLVKFSFMFDRNVDSIVSTLPSAVNGKAYYNTQDNRFYFAIGSTYFSSPAPVWSTFQIKTTGEMYQYNGTSVVQIASQSDLSARLDAIELTVSTLGSAAYENIDFFATQANLDVAEANAAAYTDSLASDLSSNDLSKGSSLVGRSQKCVWSVAELRTTPGKYINEKVNLVSYTDGWNALSVPKPFGGGQFVWDPNSLAADDGGTVFAVTGVTTGRWLREIVGEKVEAIWWGAFNSDSINAATAFAYTSTRMRTVHLCAGSWAITSKIALPSSDIHIVGDGQFTTMLIAQAGLDYIFDVGDGTTYIDNVSLKSMSLSGGNISGFIAHVRSRRCQMTWNILDVEFTNGITTSTALLATECWGMVVSGCFFTFCGRAIDITGGNAVVLEGNYIFNNYRESLVVATSSNMNIHGNAFEHWGFASHGLYFGLNFSADVYACNITGNWIESSYADNTAVNFASTCAANIFENNTVYVPTGVGHLIVLTGNRNEVRRNRLAINNASFAHIRVIGLNNDVGDNEYVGTSTQISDNTNGQYFGDKKLVYTASVTYDPPSIASGGIATTTVTVTGAALGDFVNVSFSLNTSNVVFSGRVSSANTVTVVLTNNTGAAIDLGNGTLRVRVEKV